jgi:outer membrane protein assembly factor BamB
MDHFLYALNAETGQTDWSVDLIGAIVGTPAVSEDGMIYVGSFNSELVALETETGRIVWRAPTTDWVWSGPALEGERLYFGDVSGLLYCLSRADGSQLWTYQADGSIAGKPLVTEDTVYITTDAGTLIALTKDGAVKWTQAVGGKLYSSPRIEGEIILVTSVEADAVLSAYTVNGAQAWTYAPEE